MKIKAIEKICKAAKTVHVWRLEDGRVFAGDGAAFYQLPDSLAALNARQMLDIFDVPADKRVDWIVEDRAGTGDRTERLFDLSEEDDTEARMESMTIGYGGDVWQPITDNRATIAVAERYIAPLADEGETLRCFLRRTYAGNTPLVALRSGLLLRALIMPMSPAPDLPEVMAQIAADMKGVWENDD